MKHKMVLKTWALAGAAFLLVPGAQADVSKAVVWDIPTDVAVKQFGALPGSALTADEIRSISQYRYTEDTLKVLVICVEWWDRPHTYSRETLDSMLLSRDVYGGGSLADYFDEVSYGQGVVVGQVLEWYNAGYYMGNVQYNFEALLAELDPVVDFSQFDGNGDGDVDAVIFLRSGTGQEDSRESEDIWSYAMSYATGHGPGPFDGVHVSHWNTSPELRPLRDPAWPPYFSGLDSLNNIRVFCHELAHNFGLPDLYDYDAKTDTTTYFTPADSNDHPVYDWCLMGYGGYGIFSIKSRVPRTCAGWSKMQIGWLDPIEVTGTCENLVLYDVETHTDSSLYRLPIRPWEGEYFLLEFRNPRAGGKFDKLDSDFSVYFPNTLAYGCDTLDGGLIITHVHDSLGAWWFRINYGWPWYPHYTVAVEDAGYNPAINMSANPEGYVTDSAQWWYPYETRKGAAFSPNVPGQNLFSPTTYPSSDGYEGPSGIIVRVDSIVGDRMYLYVHNPFFYDADGDGAADGADNCMDTYNPDQANADGDQFGDVCDNCPTVTNADQADYDEDGIGDACDACPADPFNDADGDTLCAEGDNCPNAYNPGQEDANEDGIGDACCCLLRGDMNLDGAVKVSDLTMLINFLFRGGPASGCPEHADVNGDGGVAVSDVTALITYLFRGGAAPPSCR